MSLPSRPPEQISNIGCQVHILDVHAAIEPGRPARDPRPSSRHPRDAPSRAQRRSNSTARAPGRAPGGRPPAASPAARTEYHKLTYLVPSMESSVTVVESESPEMRGRRREKEQIRSGSGGGHRWGKIYRRFVDGGVEKTGNSKMLRKMFNMKNQWGSEDGRGPFEVAHPHSAVRPAILALS